MKVKKQEAPKAPTDVIVIARSGMRQRIEKETLTKDDTDEALFSDELER